MEYGGNFLKVYLTIDAGSVLKTLSSNDVKTPAESTLLGHITWLRQFMERGIMHSAQCNARDVTANDLTYKRGLLTGICHCR